MRLRRHYWIPFLHNRSKNYPKREKGLLVIALLAVVVLFSGALAPFLEWEPIQPAFTYIMPVLYGIMLVPSLTGEVGKYVIISMAVVAAAEAFGLPGNLGTFVGLPIGLGLFLVQNNFIKKKETKL